jgi:hypothetical protein
MAINRQGVWTHRDLPQKARYQMYVLNEKWIQGEHVRLLGSKKDIIGKILDDFGNQ